MNAHEREQHLERTFRALRLSTRTEHADELRAALDLERVGIAPAASDELTEAMPHAGPFVHWIAVERVLRSSVTR